MFAFLQTNWLTNTGSRNAYYQTFSFRGASFGGNCAAIHYGRLEPRIEADRRPVVGGTIKLYPNQADAFVQTKLEEKRARGYRKITEALLKFEKESEFRDYLTKTFGASHRDSILQALGLKILAAFDEIPEGGGVIPPKIEIDDLCQPVITAIPEGWGAW